MNISKSKFGLLIQKMPWQYRVITFASLFFFTLIIIHFGAIIINKRSATNGSPLALSGLGLNYSIYDPSIAVVGKDDNKTGYALLAFSNEQLINTANNFSAPGIRFAVSSHNCESWVIIASALAPYFEYKTGPNNTGKIPYAVWKYETPTVIYDPDDNEKKWKYFAFKYLTDVSNSKNLPTFNGIVSGWSSNISATLTWSKEEWSLVPSTAHVPAEALQKQTVILNALDPSLSEITTYSRPSALYINNTIYMTLSAYKDNVSPDRIILIASQDHGKTWKYLNTLLTQDTVKKLGSFTSLGGASLLEQEGRVYLAAVFGNKATTGAGTFIIPVQDLNSGKLKQDAQDLPIISKTIPRQSIEPTPLGGGYAAYHDSCKTGVLTGESSGIKGYFQIFKTEEKLNDD